MITAAEVNVHHIKIPRVQKKQLENAIYWTAKKENSFDEKEFMFDYELQGEIVDQGIPKISVMVYTAPKAEIEKIRNLYTGIGVNLTGITIAPFAIQNIFRTKWMQTGEGAVATLFIGNEFSRIDIYSKDNLVMTRGIKTGTSSMIEAIAETMLEKNNLLRLDSKETYKILLSLSPDSEKLKETDAGFGLKDEEILAMIFPALERLTRQVERTLQYYTASVGHDKVEKLYVSSAMNHYAPIIYYISEQLGVKGEEFDPFIQQTSNHSITSLSISEKTALVPVLGLSFSDNVRTPNLIFTYREKSKEIGIKRINRGIFAAFAAAIIICSITIIYNFFDYEMLNNKKIKLQQELSMYNPLLSSEKISQLANEVKSKKQISRQYAERYMGMAVIGEIATITPDNIKLINLKIFSPQIKEKAESTSKDEREGITLEGIIIGERNMLDSYLAQYVMKLGSSPILRQVTVQKSNIVNFKKDGVLQFYIDAGIGKPL
jgi:Tfp pilus assembly PilM family ATPase